MGKSANDESLTENFAPHMSRSIIVSEVDDRNSISGLSDLDELSHEYINDDRKVKINFCGGEIDLYLGDLHEDTRVCAAIATGRTLDEDDDAASTMLDHVLPYNTFGKDHAVIVGIKYMDMHRTPDYSHGLDSVDEDLCLRRLKDYKPAHRERAAVPTYFGFYFIELRLSLRLDGGITKWRVIAVKIEEDDEEFEGHGSFWSTKTSRVLVKKDGRIVGPLLRQEIRSPGDLVRARRKMNIWKKNRRRFDNVEKAMDCERERVKEKRGRDTESDRDGTVSPAKRPRMM